MALTREEEDLTAILILHVIHIYVQPMEHHIAPGIFGIHTVTTVSQTVCKVMQYWTQDDFTIPELFLFIHIIWCQVLSEKCTSNFNHSISHNVIMLKPFVKFYGNIEFVQGI